MSHRARHQLLALPGIIFLVLFPIIISLWIAFLWAKSEVNNQLRTFAQLALDKSELVIRQADLVSDAAERYQGQVFMLIADSACKRLYDCTGRL